MGADTIMANIEMFDEFGQLETLGTLRITRDALKAENEALRAQLAQRWQPLPDGEITSFTYVDNGGKLLGVYAGDDYTDWYATEDLPDDIRLCRLVTQEPTL